MATGALIGAALAAGAMSAAGQMGSASMSYLYNKKLMRRQVGYQKQLMSYQHSLNSPQQQVADLRAAGLNPNLVYQGNPAMSTTIPSAPSGGHINVDVDPKVDLVGAIMSSQQYKKEQASIDSSESSTRLADAQTDKIKTENAIAKERLKQEEIKTQNYRDFGTDKKTWQGVGVGLAEKGYNWAIDTYKKAVADEQEIRAVSEAIKDFNPSSHSGRQALVNGGVSVEKPNLHLNNQEIPEGMVWTGKTVEGHKLYVPKDDPAAKQRALELERQRRKANAAKDRARRRQENSNALLQYHRSGF